MTDGEPETAVSASLQKIKSIKNQHKKPFLSIFFFISLNLKLVSFVNHFDGHFTYLKALDLSFNSYNCPYFLVMVVVVVGMVVVVVVMMVVVVMVMVVVLVVVVVLWLLLLAGTIQL